MRSWPNTKRTLASKTSGGAAAPHVRSPRIGSGRAAGTTTPRRRWSRRRRREAVAGYLFLLPWFVGLAALILGPMAISAYLSFTDYDLFNPPNFRGVENYQNMVSDEKFWQSLKVTGTYVFASVPLRLVFALAIAVALNRKMRGMSLYRALLYLPSLLAGSVAVAMLWRQLFGRDGAVNALLAMVGIEGRNWIADPSTSLWTIIVLAVWQFGSPMIIFLAGLRAIPASLLEAASIDGASKARSFFSITLPLLTPMIFFNLVMQTIVAFQAFTPAFIISGGTGGPVQSTLFYTLYLYQEGFTHFKMGYAAALAWVLLLIIAAATAANFLLSRRWVFYADEGR